MLLTMRAQVEALRGLPYLNAEHRPGRPPPPTRPCAPGATSSPTCSPGDEGVGHRPRRRADLDGVQVHGGMGYIEETGVAQHYRDIRIAPIYEGTNGIQAMDLVGRKLPMRAGA